MIKEKARSTVFMFFGDKTAAPTVVHILNGEVWKSTFDDFFDAGTEMVNPDNTVFKPVSEGIVAANDGALMAFINLSAADLGEPANGLVAEQRRKDYATLHEYITGSPFVFR